MRRALLLGLALATAGRTGAIAAGSVQVVDRLGKPAASATVVCIEPSSADVVPVVEGRATVTGACRRVRCDAAGCLPGEAELTGEAPRCVLRPAVTISGVVPAAAAATSLDVRLTGRAKGAAPAAEIAIPKPVPGATSSRFTLPPAAPGVYQLEIVRASDGWTCRADLGRLPAGRPRVNPAWREPEAVKVAVVGADDRPTAGIAVRTFADRSTSGHDDAKATGPAGHWSCGPREGGVAKTDASGAATLRRDAGGETLVVAGDWKDPRGIAYTVIDRPPQGAVRLKLQHPMTVRARVLDTKDRPVACKATFEPFVRDRAWLHAAVAGSALAPSCDAVGAFALGPLLPEPVTLSVAPKTGLPVRVNVDPPESGTTVDLGVLRVRSGESIRVEVRDLDDRPVAGATVTARGAAGILLTARGATGEGGGVELTGLPKNAVVRLEVKAPGFIDAYEFGLDLAASPFTVKLARGAAVSGTVRSADGEPVDGATVELGDDAGASARSEPSGNQGAFSIDGLADGAWHATAKAAGFEASAPVAVEVREHRSVDGVALTLGPAAGLSGRVVDPLGAAVSGARIRIVYRWEVDDPERGAPLAEATSGPDGAFQFPLAVPPEAWLIATKPGFGPAVEQSPANAARQGEVVLTLAEPAGVMVHVPAASAVRAVLVVDGAGIGRSASGATDLSFADLAPGRGRVSLLGGAERPVALVAGQTADVSLEGGASIEGRVTCEGAPAARALIQLVKDDGKGELSNLRGEFTDERGRYRIEGIAPGSFRVVAVGEDGRGETTTTVADGETARVDLALRSVRLLLTVVDGATGRPVAGASVSAVAAGANCGSLMGTTAWSDPGELGFDLQVGSNGCLSDQTNSSGLARLTLASPGSYDLSVGDSSYEPWKETAALGDGTTTKRAALTRKPDRKAEKPHVTAILHTDPPGLPGTIFCMTENSSSSSYFVVSRFDCGEMQPGPGEIVFRVDGYGRGRATFVVPESGELVVDVDVPRGGNVVVPVTGEPAAEPLLVDGSGITWSGQNGRGRAGAVLEDVPKVGRAWIFRDVPPGMYTVTVGGKARSPVPLAPGGTAVAY